MKGRKRQGGAIAKDPQVGNKWYIQKKLDQQL